MRKIKYYIILIIGVCLMTSCSDWLTVYPNNAQTTDEFWTDKSDVEGVLANGYVELRNAIDYIFVWGEVRGPNFVFESTGSNYSAMNLMNIVDITPTNRYASWGSMYNIIKMANSVIAYAPGVMDIDETFYEEEKNSLIAEAIWIRSLAYFYLVRTFKEVPFVEEPYVKDDEDYNIAKSTEYQILERILRDLENNIQYAKESFSEGEAYTKGRATKNSFNALMADIYLWRGWPGDYAKCIDKIENIEADPSVLLISSTAGTDERIETWFSNFAEGNTVESIYEIQFSNPDQLNSFPTWFNVQNRFLSSSYASSVIYDDPDDLRAPYSSSSSIGNGSIRKYIYIDWTGAVRSDESYQNFIIYRLADLYLMKAEALVMQGEVNYFTIVDEYINPIRERVEASRITAVPATQIGMLELILEERIRELYAEGKSWFDILRIAKRNNWEYHSFLISQVEKSDLIGSGNTNVIRAKLSDTFALYMPISQTEVEANALLEQNPYYVSIGL
ncbi:MAG: RagB/SusD family nutrient uptake outer membrane protein [Rikenellaceae bacterium]|nr:RagB/SusD family nutrient uptake outer membrane protein [Rikenellaceae bacterium]